MSALNLARVMRKSSADFAPFSRIVVLDVWILSTEAPAL
jgi:hypothetical protein